MSDFVLLKTFALAIEAEMGRGRLEAEGVRCFIQGSAAASVAGDYTILNKSWANPLGGTQLLVEESDLEIARELLCEIENDMSPKMRPRIRPRATKATRALQIFFALAISIPLVTGVGSSFGWPAALIACCLAFVAIWKIGS